MKYQVTEYLLKHGDKMFEDIKLTNTDACSDPSLRSYYEEAKVDALILQLSQMLNVSYEEIADVVTHEYLTELFGEEWL